MFQGDPQRRRRDRRIRHHEPQRRRHSRLNHPRTFRHPGDRSQPFPPANAVFARVSVVKIAAAASSNREASRSATNSGSAFTISPPSISTPITPVDAGSTSAGFAPISLGRCAHAVFRHAFAGPRGAVRVSRVREQRPNATAATHAGCRARSPPAPPPLDWCVNTAAADGRRFRNDQRHIVLHYFPNSRINRGISIPDAVKSLTAPLHLSPDDPFRNASAVIRFLPSSCTSISSSRPSPHRDLRAANLPAGPDPGGRASPPDRPAACLATGCNIPATAEIRAPGWRSPAPAESSRSARLPFSRIGASVACELSCVSGLMPG